MAFTIIYVWEDLDASEAEQKFGDHFAEFDTLEQAFADTRKYIRGSLTRQKHKWAEGRIVIHKMWDATDYAKIKGRFGKHKKIDDVIRPCIGHHVSADVHRIDADTLIMRVNKELIKHGQTLAVAGLSQNQYTAADNVLAAIDIGKKTVVAELCARFGKTIWSGSLIRETEARLTIVASYVLTSFTSFKKDLTSFEQFRNFVLIDSADVNYEAAVLSSLGAGKQVVVFLSMCVGGRRQSKIDFLFGIDTPRLVIVDEADFGVHKAGQSKPLIEARDEEDVIILMTGTNGDKAASIWPVDHYHSVTYPELLIEKRLGPSTVVCGSTLNHFAVDQARHALVVDVEFYQMNMAKIVEYARRIDPELFVQDGIFLAAWSKFAANPTKGKGLFINVLQAIFQGRHNAEELNVDLQTGRSIKKEGRHKVAMMFLPGSITNENFGKAAAYASEGLDGFVVHPVYGETMTNGTAEAECRNVIERAFKNGKSVLFISAGMAQRSFSIPEITELYLAYDGGDVGATIQKMSRTLTPDQVGKIGRVISLSFEPNRDDKFDAMILETAQNYMKNKGIKDLKEALRTVLRTVDLFQCQPDGAVKIEIDTYLEQALARNSIDRVIGKIAPLHKLTPEIIRALIAGKSDVFRAAQVQAAQRGKTRLDVTKNTRGITKTDSSAKELAAAREVLVTISQNMDIIRHYGGNNLDEAFAIMDAEGKEIQDDVAEQFGVEYEFIKDLVYGGILNRGLLDLKFE